MATIELDHDELQDVSEECGLAVKHLYTRLLNSPIGTGYRFTAGGRDLVVFLTPMKGHKHALTSLSFGGYEDLSSTKCVSLAEISYLTDIVEITRGRALESILNLPESEQPIHIGMWNQYMDDLAEASGEQFDAKASDMLFSYGQYVQHLEESRYG